MARRDFSRITGKLMTKSGYSIFLAALIYFGGTFALSAAEPVCPGGHRGPYGGYCQGPKWGWYGSSKEIASMQAAHAALVEYYGPKLLIRVVNEKDGCYEALILEGNKVVDKVIIHKKNGRIRSVY
jgi:hypothetical protein